MHLYLLAVVFGNYSFCHHFDPGEGFLLINSHFHATTIQWATRNDL